MKLNKVFSIIIFVLSALIFVNTIVIVVKFSGPICLNINYVNHNYKEIDEDFKSINFDKNTYAYSIYDSEYRQGYQDSAKDVLRCEGGYYVIDDGKIHISDNQISKEFEFEIMDKFSIKNYAGDVFEATTARNLFIVLLVIEGFCAIVVGALSVVVIMNNLTSKKNKSE